MTIVTKEKKQKVVDELRENVARQDAMYFINYKGLKGDAMRELRRALSKSSSKVVVARKTLMKIAFEKEGIEYNPLDLSGEVALIFAFEDGLNTAKVASKFDKEGSISFVGGFYEGNALSPEDVRSIATLPSREELLSKLVGSLASPTTGLVRVLQGNIRGLVTVLSKAKV